MTFDTKLTMALAGCSGSCSANRWHTLSVALPCFRATNPKTLQRTVGSAHQCSDPQGPSGDSQPSFLLPPTPARAPRLVGHLPASFVPSPFCGRTLMLCLAGDSRLLQSGTRGVTATSPRPARGLQTPVRAGCQAQSPVPSGRTRLPLGVRSDTPPPQGRVSPGASCACVTTTHS